MNARQIRIHTCTSNLRRWKPCPNLALKVCIKQKDSKQKEHNLEQTRANAHIVPSHKDRKERTEKKDLKRNIPNGIRVKAGKCYQQLAAAVITNYLQPTDSEKCAQDLKNNTKNNQTPGSMQTNGYKRQPRQRTGKPRAQDSLLST